MKSKLVYFVAFCLNIVVQTVSCEATILVSGFDSYADGSIIGQSSPQGQTWTQFSGSTNNLSISGGDLTLKGTGMDAYVSLGSTYASGSVLYYGLTLNFSAAGTGDLFAALTGSDGAVLGVGRLYAKSSGTGFVLGVQRAGSDSVVYGATVLNFNEDYRIVYHYTIQATNLNQSVLYVDPLNSLNESANTIYAQSAVGGGAVSFSNFQLIQNNNGPTGLLSDLVVSDLFTEAVPEPSTFLLLGLGLVGLTCYRRKTSSETR